MGTGNWFVAWVVSGRERELMEKMRLAPGVQRTLCPRQALWRRKGGLWKLTEQTLFPGYIFVQCGMTSSAYYAVRALPGVLDWLGDDGGWPVSVREEEMARVLALAQGGAAEKILEKVEIHKRQRRGYGMLTLQGKSYRIPFNVYDHKQAEERSGDSSPGLEAAEQ